MENEDITKTVENVNLHDEEIKQSNDKIRKPGELGFLVVFAFMVLALLFDSFKLAGIVEGELSAPSTLPQVMLFSILAMMVFQAVLMLWGRERKSGIRIQTDLIVSFLISREVIIILVMVLAYVLLLPVLRFAASSAIFLSMTMYLLERRDFVKKIIISVGLTAIVVVIFQFLMGVVLP